jgi:PAS domain S-box-containing protein
MSDQKNQDLNRREGISSSNQTLYNIIVKLNEATTLRDIIGDITEPAFQAGASEAQLFLFYQDEYEHPAYADMAVNWQPAGRVAQIPEGTRLNLADFPLINQWLMNPDDPILISDLAKEDRIDIQAKALLQHNGIVTTIVLPLVLDKKWIGLIFINWETHHQFFQNDIDLYKVIARQTTIAVNNRLLIDQTNRRAKELATVAEISTTIASQLNQQEMLQTVVDLTKERFGLYHAHIYLLDAERDRLTLAAGAGEVGKKMVAQGWQIPLDREQSLVARAARSHKGVIINNVQAEPGFLPNELLPNTHSEMAIPLLVGPSLLGVLDVQSNIVGRFTFEDVGIQTTLAFQVAAALQNARQFAQVQQQEQLIHTIIDSTPDLIYFKDTQHRYRLVNKIAANSVLHMAPEDVVGKNDLELGFPDDLVKGNPEKGISGYWADDNLVMETNEAKVYPNNLIAIDGAVRIFHTYKIPLKGADGNLSGVLAYSRDISDQLKTEETLRQNDAQLSQALNIAMMGNWEYDVINDLFTFNDQFYKVYKTTAEEQGGYTMSSAEYTRRFLHPEDAGIVGAEIVKALETTDPNFNGHVDHRYIRKDGTEGYITARFRIIKDAQGRTVRTYGANQDVTERILAEKALRDSESLQRTLLENLGIGIIIVDPETHIIESVNPAVAVMFGASASQLKGMQCHHALCPSNEGACPITDLGQEVDNADRQFVRADGTRIPVLKSVKRIWVGDQEKLLESFIDISDRKKAEEALKSSQEKLSEALVSSKMGYWDYDVLTDVYTFNDQFYSIFHTSAEEQGGYTMSSGEYSRKFTLPEDGPVVGEAIRQALETTDPNYSAALDHRFIRADGSQGYLTARFRILKDAQGRTVKFIGANQDITAQKTVELALSKEQERLSEALTNAKMGYWEYDVPTGIYTFNDQFYAIYHTTAAEQGGYTMSAQDYSQRFTMPEEDGPVVFAEIQKALETTDPNYSTTIVHRFIRSDKTEGYLTVRLHILKDSQGNTIKFIGANQDTTEQKTVELALSKEQERLSEALATAKMGYWEYDVPTGTYTFNDQFYSIYHTTAAEQGGYRMSAQDYSQRFTMPEEDGPVVFAEIQKAMETTDPNYSTTIVHRYIRSDKTEGYLTVRLHILKDSQGNTIKFIGANQDTTEQKLAELALARNARELATVAEVSTTVSTKLDPQDMLQTVVDLTKERFGLYHAHIYLLDADGDSLTLAAGAGEVGKQMVSQGWKIPWDRKQSLVARAVRTRQGVIINDVRTEPGFMPNELLPDTRAEMAVPILVGDTLLGVLDVQADKVGRFMDEDVRIMTTLSAQVAVAVQNSRQFAQVKQQEQLVRTIIDSTPDWIFIKDTQHRYSLVNQGYSDSLHIKSEDFIGKDDLDLGFPEELVKGNPEKGIRGFWSDDNLVMESRQAKIYPDDPATIDGVVHTFHTYKTPLIDAQGNLSGVLAFSRDISDRIKAEETLRQNEARLVEALTNAKMAYWEYDVPTGTYTFNDQFYSIYHTTAQEQGGYIMSAQDYAQRFTMPEEDGPVVFAEIQKALETTDPNYSTTIDHRFIRSDGTQGYLTVRLHILKDSEGHTIKFIGANQDITEQKLVELALSKEQERLSEALQNAKMGYWEYDVPTGTYTFNDQFYSIYHTTAQEQGGYIMSAQDYSQRFTMPEEDGPIVFAEIQKALETTDPNYSTTIVHRFIRSDGTEGYLTVRLHILKDSQGNTVKFIGANQDTTEQKLAELSLAKRAAQLATVSDVATAVATILSPDILLQKVVDLTKASFGLYHAHIYLMNQAGSALVLAAGAGEVGKLMVSQGWQIPLDREQSLVARTARTHKGIIVSDVRSEHDFMPNPLLPDTRSEMAVPMIVGDTLLGVLDVQSNQPAYFTDEDIRIETTLAIQVAVALQNARTYAQSQRQAEQEALINEISQKIQTTTSVESAMQVAVRELGRALGAKRTSVQLSLDRKQSTSGNIVVEKSQNDN